MKGFKYLPLTPTLVSSFILLTHLINVVKGDCNSLCRDHKPGGGELHCLDVGRDNNAQIQCGLSCKHCIERCSDKGDGPDLFPEGNSITCDRYDETKDNDKDKSVEGIATIIIVVVVLVSICACVGIGGCIFCCVQSSRGRNAPMMQTGLGYGGQSSMMMSSSMGVGSGHYGGTPIASYQHQGPGPAPYPTNSSTAYGGTAEIARPTPPPPPAPKST